MCFDIDVRPKAPPTCLFVCSLQIGRGGLKDSYSPCAVLATHLPVLLGVPLSLHCPCWMMISRYHCRNWPELLPIWRKGVLQHPKHPSVSALACSRAAYRVADFLIPVYETFHINSSYASLVVLAAGDLYRLKIFLIFLMYKINR